MEDTRGHLLSSEGEGVTGWDIAFYVIVAAIVYSLVRPGSPAGTAIIALADLTEGVVGTATGYAFASSNKKG